ncbi:MAG: hypothetical protein KAJ57_00790 [Woeseiaceae bacterium]|nr:hypothetical protein [Woeseiaceae bacterium]
MSKDDMKDTRDDEMIYGLTADERDALLGGLRDLPDTMPPRAVWYRIREQAEAEGLITRPASRRPSSWYLGGSLAAAALLGVFILPGVLETPTPNTYTTPSTVATNPPVQLTTLQTLMVESRRLENDLRELPAEPRVVRAGTAATIVDLEDRIAAIDYQLNDPEFQLNPEEEEIFWRERVRLMKLLVGMRYAQAQRTAF